jgi:hypothetical protein
VARAARPGAPFRRRRARSAADHRADARETAVPTRGRGQSPGQGDGSRPADEQT